MRPDGTVKVLDFGIAKALEAPAGTSGPHSPALTTPAMTMSGIILGTAAYMSPEQARGKTVDERADIWAFGCVLFEMLTGQPVFGGEDITTTLARVLEREVDLSAMVYRSSGSGAFQVMVQPFPPDGSSTRVSPAGEIATRPVWSADGSTLYYQGPANQGFSAVDIAVPGFALRNRRELPHRGNPNAHRLAVMPDGKLVLTIPQAAALGGTVMRTELVVVENWIEEVKQRVPRN